MQAKEIFDFFYPGAGYASLVFILGLILLLYCHESHSFTCINSYPWDLFQRKAKQEFESDARGLIDKGLQMGRSAFQLVTNMGTYLILSDRYAEEIKNDDRFSAFDALNDVILLELPGFETMFQGSLHNHVSPVAVWALNRELVHLTRSLSDETGQCLQAQWTDATGWHNVSIHDTVLTLVAQLTTRALIGPELCRNPEWIDIAISFTIIRAIAVADIQSWPRILQPVVHWFLPTCKAVRRQIKRAQDILMPVLHHKKQSINTGDHSTEHEFSTLTFIDQYAQGSRYDATMAQLRLIAVSVLTTSDMVEKVLARFCEYPELIEPLRDEVILAFEKSGLNHNSLLKLTLMESVMKESQRLEPATLISMFRVAKEKVTLEDGTIIPKGTSLAFANELRLDPSMYPDPEKFDGYRFQNMRKSPEKAGLAQFTKTRVSHLAFGHGRHACPGRFLSCDEAKLILCHILLKYDIKPADEHASNLAVRGMFIQRDSRGVMSVKLRETEVML
ncbi:uncharacterized protein N7443_005312 [Penicillium atrosanguineum]|uniref:uncharacterized protein n=1 Tax=Penicillium atrosanguineum TaxID=1132637 RepID=UPI00238D588F|nr:uncharacterized protein N7443_005312 [Penicillium atrosanguineum]KAJ5300310.1 hypothetical protein N7443_005312 [Penicillium atrosanguineum]